MVLNRTSLFGVFGRWYCYHCAFDDNNSEVKLYFLRISTNFGDTKETIYLAVGDQLKVHEFSSHQMNSN